MKLKVENFGPIKSADVEIGPMTVFVGHSNTGKSYLAGLVYAIASASSLASGKFLLKIYNLDKGLLQKLGDMFAHDQKIDQQQMQKSPAQFLSLVDVALSYWASVFSEVWKEKMTYCFGAEGKKMLSADNLVVQLFDDQRDTVLDLCIPDRSQIAESQRSLLLDLVLQQVGKPAPFDEFLNRDFFKMLAGPEKKDSVRFIPALKLMAALIVSFKIKAFKIGYLEQYYLPASRGGIMQSHRALVDAVFQQAATSGLSEAKTPPSFTGVFSDFARKLTALQPDMQSRRETSADMKKIVAIGNSMESGIMKGKIKVKKSATNYPDFRYAFPRKSGSGDLPLMSASSMVSELAPLSLFMRHYVKPDDLFIIEEPEAHLHPGAQLEVTKVLVQLVHADVRVLVTTHSDNVLEQLNNFVVASNVDAEITEQKLEQDKLKVYLFEMPENVQDGVTVRLVPFDKESGILTDDHLAISAKLYNESVDLFNAGNRAAEGKGKYDN